jgi:serine/threonine-protein kinase
MSDIINDRYRILRELGSGGMGKVVLAEDLARDGTRVALKLVGPPDGPVSKKFLADALIREFETLARLNHPNLPGVHDFGKIPADGSLLLSMEYVEGKELLEAAGSLEPAEIVAVIAQVCRALEFIHTRGLVHGDVKPQNILVTPDNGPGPRAVLVDFGLAARTRSEGQLRGTLHYVAPEVLRREKIDRRADLYALGVVLYRLATGRCPFSGTSSEVIRGILETTPPPLEQTADPERAGGKAPGAPLRPLLGEGLSSMILKLLDKDPAQRYRTAGETLQALNRATGAEHPMETADTGDAYSSAATMVGRDEEVARVEGILDRLAGRLKTGLPSRESALVLVIGEAGSARGPGLPAGGAAPLPPVGRLPRAAGRDAARRFVREGAASSGGRRRR